MTKKIISEEDFIKLARLSRLSVKPEEIERLSEKFNEIIDFVQKLQAYDTDTVAAMSHVHGVTNVFREDEGQASFDANIIKEIAPDTSANFIRVPIIIDQESGEN
ncbi:MAG: Asp-tRNA(Asn)/Glu-tRNA(Gln) amidotransferase subunit GatC [SAR324 cluster bacterium]|uniref:Aspartyl/glutamyl-tRNA(Asn/Gln) amidotransferase subunit C n=1 Tax=SAR324 cluster bacterium TaxID=2024889 RepID=A0A7X9FSD4_9DELT|nr:Asp-tRNA(Asn)/Glu-tRNA(Gln) amidotransferase subunit GatC [SAR324 cluster bacterium]